MVKKKRQSKRTPAAKRYKIEKKVREHKRKIKKEAKLKTKTKRARLRKDPGIPNLFPFKEQVLKEIEAKKEKERENHERHQKEQRQREITKRRSLQSFQNDINKRTKQFEKKEASRESTDGFKMPKSESSLKAFYKEFRKVVDGSDVILEVLDARDPLGCRCIEMEQTVLASGSNKKLILILNKIDLIPRDNVTKWLKYLRNEFPTIAFKASTQSQKSNLSCKTFQLSNTKSFERSSVCLGSDMLMKLLGNYCRSLDIKTSITVGVVGLPNVGKSSIINSLKRHRVCNVGATPGITRSMQEIQLDKHIKLLDCPGIVMAGDNDPSAPLRNGLKVEGLSDKIGPVEAILKRCDSKSLILFYAIPDYSDTEEFLSHLARRTGKLKKGGIPNISAAASKVLLDWNTGKIKFYTHPPEKPTVHISSEIVSEWSRAFDMSGVLEEEEKLLAGLSDKIESALVIDSSQPVERMATFTGDDKEEDDEIEEDMGSEVESDSSDGEDMNEEQNSPDVTVCLDVKKSKHSKRNDEVYNFNQYF